MLTWLLLNLASRSSVRLPMNSGTCDSLQSAVLQKAAYAALHKATTARACLEQQAACAQAGSRACRASQLVVGELEGVEVGEAVPQLCWDCAAHGDLHSAG